ncbi:MAG: TfoX/Sxy family protein [Candidatus Nitrotoga sp.]
MKDTPIDIPTLLKRIRTELAGVATEEKRMFGGITLMLNGNMLCCISKKGLMIRVGKEAEARALRLPHAQFCEGAGRKMPGFIMVAPEGIQHNGDLAAGLKLALDYVSALPIKIAKPKATATRPKLGTLRS